MTKGALVRAGTVPGAAFLDDSVLLPEVLLPPVMSSLVEAWSIAHCEPGPLRPGPGPAPSSKNCSHFGQRSHAITGGNKGKSYGLGARGNGGESGRADVPVLILSGACSGLGRLGVAAVASGGGVLLQGALEGSELGALNARTGLVGVGILAARDVDNAELVGLVGVLVHDAARVDSRHVVGHEGPDLAKVALVGDAAVLRQEDGDAEVGKGLDLLVPPGRDEVTAAPRVVILHDVLAVAYAIQALGEGN